MSGIKLSLSATLYVKKYVLVHENRTVCGSLELKNYCSFLSARFSDVFPGTTVRTSNCLFTDFGAKFV